MANQGMLRERWRKAELHSHCSLDPIDYRVCGYSPERLIATAAGMGYEILAITCHNLDVWTRDLAEYAESLGVTLIPGMEVTVEGTRHTLVYNFQTGPENLNTLAKIRSRRRDDTLVIAPHPYYPTRMCLRQRLERNIEIFDAVEQSGFYTQELDFNRRARRVAGLHNKPIVGNGDVHMLWQLGRTYTWIYSEPGTLPVLSAVKRGAVRLESASLSYAQVARWWATMLYRYVFPVHPAPTRGEIGSAVAENP
jgi:predicted metal-dependent phosphoesterase TrpH